MTDLQICARSFDPDAAATRLAEAWSDNFLIHEFARSEHPETEAEGYVIQRKLAEKLGEPISGYKLGLGSSAAMRRTGLGHPVWGFMTRLGMYPDSAMLPAIMHGDFLVEIELAFVATRPVSPGEGLDDLLSAWTAHVAVEIVRPRLANWGALGVPSFIADSVGFHAFVLGQEVPPGVLVNRTLPPAILIKDGVPVAPAAEESECADPFAALDYFLARAAAENIRIAKGTVVTTGNLVIPLVCSRGGAFEGRIGASSVRCTVAPPR